VSGLTRRIAAVASAVALCVAVGATPAIASTGHDPQRTIAAKTGSSSTLLHSTRTVSGYTIRQARSGDARLETYVQDRSDGFAVAAVLERGQSRARFGDLLRPGQRAEPDGAGGLVVLQGNDVVATIDAPWAVDAHGRDLPTRYSVEGDTIVQSVDTADATFPVVADPSVKTGFHIVPVFYVQFTWTETWWVKNHLPYAAISTALLCSRTGPAAPFCAFYGAIFVQKIRAATDAAIAAKRCLKLRLPATTGAIGLPAFAAYYVKCTS
jgi:hypothetical protein